MKSQLVSQPSNTFILLPRKRVTLNTETYTTLSYTYLSYAANKSVRKQASSIFNFLGMLQLFIRRQLVTWFDFPAYSWPQLPKKNVGICCQGNGPNGHVGAVGVAGAEQT